jgi:hypothetical protein
MSAWAEIVNADGGDEWLEKCNAALLEVQSETLRRAARRIRNPEELRDYTDDHMSDCNMAADLIDPEVD